MRDLCRLCQKSREGAESRVDGNSQICVRPNRSVSPCSLRAMTGMAIAFVIAKSLGQSLEPDCGEKQRLSPRICPRTFVYRDSVRCSFALGAIAEYYQQHSKLDRILDFQGVHYVIVSP